MAYDVITINSKFTFFYIFCNQGQFFQSSKKIKKIIEGKDPLIIPFIFSKILNFINYF